MKERFMKINQHENVHFKISYLKFIITSTFKFVYDEQRLLILSLILH